MPVVLYNIALAVVFTLGIATMMQPHRQTRGYLQTLKDIELAGLNYIGQHCNALPDAVTAAQLQVAGQLDNGFDDQGVVFTWRLADHPAISVNAKGEAGYLAFLAGRTLGGFEADGSYSFIPNHNVTLLHAANNWYNLFAYAGNDFSCASS